MNINLKEIKDDLIQSIIRQLYTTLCDFVAEYQGQEGYIDTQVTEEGEEDLTAEVLIPCEGGLARLEKLVYGIRVDESGKRLFIATEFYNPENKKIWTEEDFKKEENWQEIGNPIFRVVIFSTLLSICDGINQFVEESNQTIIPLYPNGLPQ